MTFSLAYGGFSYSDSWAGVGQLCYFEGVHIPGRTNYGGVVPGYGRMSSGLVKGDLLFYDWGNDGILDHVAMMVGTGTDPNSPGWTGDLQDQHTTNRYRAYWTLAPYNQNVLVTKIYRMHIYATN